MQPMNPDEYNTVLANLGAMVGIVSAIDFERVGLNLELLETVIDTTEKTDDGEEVTPEMRETFRGQLAGIRKLYLAARGFRDRVPQEILTSLADVPITQEEPDDDSTA